MLFPQKRPAPPNWKIFLYCLIALLILCGLGWINTHLLGDHTQYDERGFPVSSASESA